MSQNLIEKLKGELSSTVDLNLEKPCDNDKSDWLKSARLWWTSEELNSNKTYQNMDHSASPHTLFKTMTIPPQPYVPAPPVLSGQIINPVALNLGGLPSDRPLAPRYHLIHPFSKPRRHWSQDLHHRFVRAMEQLGGAEVATPKKIKDLMGVSDLTIDQIKSHLQKYRFYVSSLRAGPLGTRSQMVGGQGSSGNGGHDHGCN